MRLVGKRIDAWPKLAWVARIKDGSDTLNVCYGPMVEITEQWVVEAVWAGDFAAGNFDQTDLVFGTGIRCRGDHVTFVSSGTVFDRLWHCRNNKTLFVANSLPALLAMARLDLCTDYDHYSWEVMTIARGGLTERVRTIPTKTVDIDSTYYNNLVFDQGELKEIGKPDSAPSFKSFEDYYQYLTDTAAKLGVNCRAPERTNKITPLSSISSGYDSCATATISRLAGCKQTVTIRKSASLWRGSDSGAPVAEQLGMSCTEYPRTAAYYPQEEAVWAAEGRAGILNWTLFDYPEPLCLFFTGCHGEKMWDRVDHDQPDPFVRRDTASLGFTEYRLHRGVFQCVMPFWGVRHSRELRAITLSPSMRPWYTNKDYDKPIARRIIEQAGIPRGFFGMLKKNVSHESLFLWPYSANAGASFRRYLAEQGHPAPPAWVIRSVRCLSYADSLFYKNITRRFGLKRGRRLWDRFAGPSLLFKWANSGLKKTYTQGMQASGWAAILHYTEVGDSKGTKALKDRR